MADSNSTAHPEPSSATSPGAQGQQAAPVFAQRRSVEIMATLRAPDGCPWDREQTFDSIKRHTLEETYEVFDAIERRAWPDLKDELGDLLLQVLFYAQMASEAGYFTIVDVAENLNAKAHPPPPSHLRRRRRHRLLRRPPQLGADQKTGETRQTSEPHRQPLYSTTYPAPCPPSLRPPN